MFKYFIWGLIENLCGVPAVAHKLKQDVSHLLASAQERVSPTVNTLQLGFGIVQLLYHHYPVC